MNNINNDENIIVFFNTVNSYSEVFIHVFSIILFCVLIGFFTKYKGSKSTNKILNGCGYFIIVFFILHNLFRIVYYGEYLDITDKTIDFFEINTINIYNLMYSAFLSLIIINQKMEKGKLDKEKN